MTTPTTTPPTVAPKPAVTTTPAVKPVGIATTPAKPGVLNKSAAPSGAAKTVLTPVSKPTFRIRNKSDRAKEQYIKMLVYGDYGTGKTFLAGTAAGVKSMNDVLLISAESGELTLDSEADNKYNFENIDSIKITDYKTISLVFQFLQAHILYRDIDTPEARQKLIELEAKFSDQKAEDIEEPRRYRTVIIDSLTEVEQYCMNQLLGISATTGLSDETQTAEWSEYKKQHGMVQRLVRQFRDLPMHVIMTCARQYTQDEAKRMMFTLQLTGKLAGQVQGFMDIVGYLVSAATDSGDINRRLFVQPTGRFSAKCRLSNYKKPHWDNPVMADIIKDVGMLNRT